MSSSNGRDEEVKVALKEETPSWMNQLRELDKHEYVVAAEDHNLNMTVFVGMSVGPGSFTRVHVPWYDVCKAGFEPSMLGSCAHSIALRKELLTIMENK